MPCQFGVGFDIPTCLACLWNATQAQRKNLSDLDKNIDKLVQERTNLKNKKDEWQTTINEKSGSGFEPTEAVHGLLEDMNKMEAEISDIVGAGDQPTQLPVKCLSGCCYKNIRDAYDLAQRIPDILLQVRKLIEQRPDERMFVPTRVEKLPIDHLLDIDPRVEKLWDLVKDENKRIIKIIGMGGVGKSALMERTHNKFLEDMLGFDIVIWVDAAKIPTTKDIQVAIANRCRLSWPTDVPESRLAAGINIFLSKKKFVLFIDDPHKDLTLTRLGIPISGQNKCKIIFATRSESVTLDLSPDQYYKYLVQSFTWEDAWPLFRNKIGAEAFKVVEAHMDLVKNVVNFCGGLPLMLVNVGKAMSTRRTLEQWLHIKARLENFVTEDLDVETKVFPRFNFTYKDLTEVQQKCFLYCSMFPKDFSVTKEELLDYWLAENFLPVHDVAKLNDARHYGVDIINVLINAYWLEKGDSDSKISMHDTIRGFALWKAKQNKEQRETIWVSTGMQLEKLPTTAEHLNWELVEKISLTKCLIKKLETPTGIRFALTTLILKHCKLKEISPGFFQAMVSLKVLDLSWCDIYIFPTGITSLTTLQYLNMSYTYISALPNQFGNLTCLKLLNLSFIPKLVKVPPGVIKKLSKLVVLNLYSSGYDSDQNAQNGESQSLVEELDCLCFLEDIRITITNVDDLKTLGQSTKLSYVQALFITNCSGSPLEMPFTDRMGALDAFRVYGCPNLRNLKVMSFTRLRCVEIENCRALHDLTWLIYAPTLESLKVVKCVEMVEIISSSSSSSTTVDQNNPLFSKLKSIELSDVFKLKVICGRALQFPSLENITVESCPDLHKLPLATHSTTKGTFRSITGQQKWWDSLQWEEQSIKKKFFNYFRRID